MGRTQTIKEKKKEDEAIYCLCRKPDDGMFMVGCDFCSEWFHGKCVGLTKKDSSSILRYSCPTCLPNNPIVYAAATKDEDDYESSEQESEEDSDEGNSYHAKRKKSYSLSTPRKELKKEGQLTPLRYTTQVVPSSLTSTGKIAAESKQREKEAMGKKSELDETRKKSRSILLDALMSGMKQDRVAQTELDDPETSEERRKTLQITRDLKIIVQPGTLADEIEAELFKQLYSKEIGLWKDYNAKLRSLAFNLKDPKNPLLRARLLSRELDPSQLPPISSADLANPELTMIRRSLEMKALKNVTIDTKEVEREIEREKKWRGGLGKTKSEYSSAEVIMPTEINTSLPLHPSTTTTSDDPEAEEREEGEDGEDGTLAYEEGEDGGAEGEVEHDGISLDLTLGEHGHAGDLEAPASNAGPPPLPARTIWEGTLDMSTMSEMPSSGYLKKKCYTRAQYVSGPDMAGIHIEPIITVKGKISIPKLYPYLAQIEASSSRAVTVAAVEPIGDDDSLVYKTAFNYFTEKQRGAVFSVRSQTQQLPSLEEIYLTPVPIDVPHDFPALLRPPSRSAVTIGGKFVAVFIMRTAPATAPYGKSTSPRRKSASRSTGSSHTRATTPPDPTKDPRVSPLLEPTPQIPPIPQLTQLTQLTQLMQQPPQVPQQLQQPQQQPQDAQQQQQQQNFEINAELLENLMRIAQTNTPTGNNNAQQPQQYLQQQYHQNGNYPEQGSQPYANNNTYFQQ